LQLPDYERVLARVFNRYGIGFFIDHREPLSHHPLAELTRYALRVVVSNWEHDDWFGALKTGLVHREAGRIDEMENRKLCGCECGRGFVTWRDRTGLEKYSFRLQLCRGPSRCTGANRGGSLQDLPASWH
jgi:hypothetical protein